MTLAAPAFFSCSMFGMWDGFSVSCVGFEGWGGFGGWGWWVGRHHDPRWVGGRDDPRGVGGRVGKHHDPGGARRFGSLLDCAQLSRGVVPTPVWVVRVSRNVERFRGGLVIKTYRVLYLSTLGL